MVVPDSKEDRFSQLFSVSYNVNDVDLSELFSSAGFNTTSRDGRNLFNFVPEFLALDKFIELHEYLDSPFRKTNNIGLDELLYVLWAISSLALIPNRELSDTQDYLFFLFQLLRRGYSVYRANASELGDVVLARLKHYPNLTPVKLAAIEAVLPSALARITLYREQQEKISPWSGGPRAIVIPCGEFVIIDVVGILGFVTRMFTGIRDDGTARGGIFEETVRVSITKLFEEQGFGFGPRKLYKDGVLIDEIDLMLRKGRRVFVCECFSMWLPLNFEIGDETTINNRTAQIDKKINQAEQTCVYLFDHRRGSNYDFADVDEFVPIVVSPFVEWLPNTSARYWLSKEHPRVMAVDELVRYLREQN